MPPKKRTAKKATPKPAAPPAPPQRGRATKGPKAPAERGKQTRPAPKTPATPSAPLPPKPAPKPAGKPGVLERVATPKPGATYHRAVLAEFIGALVLAVVGGVLSPRKRADGQPTWVHLIVQVTAIAGVFFVLALLSASPRIGKIAAAFGLLVFLGVLINSADAVRKMAAVFAPTKQATTEETTTPEAGG